MPGKMPQSPAIGHLKDEALPGDEVADVEALEIALLVGQLLRLISGHGLGYLVRGPLCPLALQAGGTVEGVRQHGGIPPHLVQEAGQASTKPMRQAARKPSGRRRYSSCRAPSTPSRLSSRRVWYSEP